MKTKNQIQKKGFKKKKASPEVVNVAAAKTHLSQYLARAKHGQDTVVTEYRVPIAKIVPFIASKEDFEIIEPTESLELLKKAVHEPSVKRTWESLTLLTEDRE